MHLAPDDKDLPLFQHARFNGADYRSDRDDARLTGQLRAIYDLMKDGGWRSLSVIEAETKAPQASVSAQLRNLRKTRFGGFTVERKHLGDGLYVYRVLPATT